LGSDIVQDEHGEPDLVQIVKLGHANQLLPFSSDAKRHADYSCVSILLYVTTQAQLDICTQRLVRR
jgi:hypothetical protein